MPWRDALPCYPQSCDRPEKPALIAPPLSQPAVTERNLTGPQAFQYRSKTPWPHPRLEGHRSRDDGRRRTFSWGSSACFWASAPRFLENPRPDSRFGFVGQAVSRPAAHLKADEPNRTAPSSFSLSGYKIGGSGFVFANTLHRAPASPLHPRALVSRDGNQNSLHRTVRCFSLVQSSAKNGIATPAVRARRNGSPQIASNSTSLPARKSTRLDG